MPLCSPSPRRTSSTATSGRQLADSCDGLVGGAGLADDREVALGVERGGDTSANDFVVIEQEDADHAAIVAQIPTRWR
jgi:hypothetical protein